MKKFMWMAAALFVIAGLFRMDARAQSIWKEEGKVVVALGADLTEEQKDIVLGLFGITREQLADYEVITITNAQEHQYLDPYLDPSVIGSKSLSSVMLKKGEAGSGVFVTTKNINFCTTGMYRNALLTAGIQDTEVIVAAPAPISGSAALIGAVKAYEKMEGTSIPDDTLSNALNELITTGELAAAVKTADVNISSAEIEQLIAWLKEKVAKGELESEEDIRAAVKEGEEKFGVVLSEDEVKMILDLMGKLESIGLNSEYLLSQAEKLYNKYGADMVQHADEAISEAVSSAVNNAADGFFQNLKKSVKDFLGGIFG